MHLSDSDIKALKAGAWKEFSSKDVDLAVKLCQQYELNPLKNEIYLIPRGQGKKRRLMAQVSIDGYRIIAGRHADYEGQTSPLWCGDDGEWKEVWLDTSNPPAACKIGVYRKGAREPTYAVLTWNEYKDNAGRIAQKMKAHMLAKAVETLALRKAFPDAFAGLYTDEELDTGGEQPMSPKKIELLLRMGEAAGMETDQLASTKTWAEQQKEKRAGKAFAQMVGRVLDSRGEEADGTDTLNAIEEALSGKDEAALEEVVDGFIANE